MSDQVVSADDVNAILNSLAPNCDTDDEFARFLLPTYSDIQWLVAKWQPGTFVYGSIAPDWPLCYDFAEECAAWVRGQAYREGCKMRPAFGTLRYTMNALDANGNNKRHAICFIVLDTIQVKYYEPETGAWMDQPDDMKSMESFSI